MSNTPDHNYPPQKQALIATRYQQNERFAHPIDENFLHQVRRSHPITPALRQKLNEQLQQLYETYIRHGSVVKAEQMPRLYNVLQYCAQRLFISLPLTVVGQGMATVLDAFTVGTDEIAYLVLSPRVSIELPLAELTFVIGHECGHIALEHVLYHTLLEMEIHPPSWYQNLLQGASSHLMFGQLIVNRRAFKIANQGTEGLQASGRVLLATWQKLSEISADRAGLLCCQDLHAAERALLMFASGDTTLTQEEINTYFSALSTERRPLLERLYAQHPVMMKRIQCLRLFASSIIYYELTNQPYPAVQLLSSIELRKRTAQVLLR
jgi:hypothetical protein